MKMAKCNICEKTVSLRGVKGHIRFTHPEESEDNYEELGEQEELEETQEKEQKFDKKIETKSDLVKTLREQYEILNYQRMIENLQKPPEQSQAFTPKDMMQMFAQMQNQMIQMMQTQQKTSLSDELQKLAQLKDIAKNISEGEIPTEEGISDKQLMDGLMEVVKASAAKREPPPTLPQQQIIQQAQTPQQDINKVYPLNKESENMELIDLLTPDAQKRIASMDKEMAWNLCRSFLAISKEEFDDVYDKCKKMSGR